MKKLIVLALIFSCLGSTVYFNQCASAQEAAVTASEPLRPAGQDYDAGKTRDPFDDYLPKKPVMPDTQGGGSVSLPTLTIQGIVFKSDNPYAIINDKVVRTGDTVDGVEVTKIEKDRIIVSHMGKEHYLAAPAKQSLEKKPEGGKNEASIKQSPFP